MSGSQRQNQRELIALVHVSFMPRSMYKVLNFKASVMKKSWKSDGKYIEV